MELNPFSYLFVDIKDEYKRLKFNQIVNNQAILASENVNTVL